MTKHLKHTIMRFRVDRDTPGLALRRVPIHPSQLPVPGVGYLDE